MDGKPPRPDGTAVTALAGTAGRGTAVGSKSEQAYAAVKEKILDGGFAPGRRLVLAALAGELGCSVVPVREAIRRLEAEGLVVFERNVGAAVAGADPVEYFHTMQTLSLVEGAATALAAALLTPADIARARSVNAAMRAGLEHFDPVHFTALHQQFHAILVEDCPNPHILDLVRRGWNRLQGLRSSSFSQLPGRARQAVAEHEMLLKLIERGSAADDVERAARAHRTATLDAYPAHPGNADSGNADSSGAHQTKGTTP